METYNYKEAIKADVLEYVSLTYLNDNGFYDFSDFDSMEELEETLNEELFINDSVTGNASGSYTFSTWKAEENLCHNLYLYFDALSEFGFGGDFKDFEPEGADVTIRCYLLPQAIAEILEEITDSENYTFGEEEEEEEE